MPKADAVRDTLPFVTISHPRNPTPTASLRDCGYVRVATTPEPSSNGHATAPCCYGSAASSRANNATASSPVKLLEFINRKTGRLTSAE
jgi:hypothetical protein